MTSINSEKSKRIAKNTVVLYIRMIVVMLVALYTSRVILKALGVEDYGLYNVVGGVVSLFSFLRSSMEKATQRFLNVEMARGEVGDLTKVFCVSVTIHIVIVALVLLLTETIGLWFLNNYIQIPVGREMAANWVYQATVFSLCFTILSVPYSADIIAHEKMSFYAIVSVLDAFLKLAIAFLVMHDDGDRLILYGFLMMGVSIVNWFLYAIYCRRKYVETRFRFLFDKSLFKEMFSFTGWTLLGQAAIIGTNQGNSILVNVFHSVTANAAMSIGSQVNGAVVSLSANFQTAFNPQITQSYAEGDRGYLKFLIVTTSKLSFFLLFIVSMPIVFNINTLLDIWLDVVPDGAAIFCIYTLAGGIVNSLSTPLGFCVNATGKIRDLQIWTLLVYLSDLFFLFLLFKAGFPPETSVAVKLVILILVLFVRLFYTTKYIDCLKIKDYLSEVIVPVIIISGISILTCYGLTKLPQNSYLTVLYTFIILIVTSLSSIFVGLTKREQSACWGLVKSVIHRK